MNTPSKQHLIGEASKRSGVHIETIRYYEKIGLMPSPQRSSGGQRVYDEDQTKRLFFIKRCRELGFSLSEIESLFKLIDSGNQTCKEVHTLTVNHLESVRQKIIDMRKVERVLKNMSDQCTLGSTPNCPVIDVLFGI